MSSQVHFPERLLRSLFDLRFYFSVLKEKTSKAISYGVLMAMFFGSLTMIRPMVEWGMTIDGVVSDLETQVSEFNIAGGELQADVMNPYALNTDGFAIVVDPRGNEIQLQKDAYGGIYFQKTKVILVNGASKPQQFEYTALFREGLTKEGLLNAVSSARIIGWFFIPLGALYGLVLLFLSSTVTMLIGRLVFLLNRKVLKPRDNFVISLYSQTLTGTLLLFSVVFMANIPFFYPLCIMLMSLYYYRLARWEEPEDQN